MKEPLVTVFIPVFNAEKFISRAIGSITEQSYKNMEILIINDGSNDGTIDIINKITDSRIKIINNNENKGLPYTRSLAINKSSGKYLAFLDADDFSCSNRIAKQVHYLEENSDCDILFTDINIINKRRIKIKKKINNNQIKYSLLYKNIICNSSIMIRKNQLIKEKLTYNSKYFVAQDYRLWIDCINSLNFGYLPERLVYYRRSNNNITSTSYKDETKFVTRLSLINQIHKVAFHNLKIPITDNELALFNQIFNETIYSKDATYTEIMNIFKLLERIGKKNEKLCYKDWIEVLRNNTFRVMLNSKNVVLRESIVFYAIYIKQNKLLNFMMLVNSILKRLKRINFK